MRGKLALLLALILTLSGCAQREEVPLQRYQASFLELFDTVTTVVGYAGSEEEFSALVQPLYDQLLAYHQLCDIYHSYPGVNNLKTVREQAGESPVTVDPRLVELMIFCKEAYALTGGRVNVAMGRVLSLWHDAREGALASPERAAIPDRGELEEAARHTGLDALVIDREASTLYLSDPEVMLDVGAIAKGWAVERVCQTAPAGLLVSVGGNVRATGPKSQSGQPWTVGVQDPDGEGHLRRIPLSEGAVVTSGDYQRCFTVDGTRYHHIIDPDTLMPGERWRSVTVVCENSGLADVLSTALFLMSREEGQRLLEQLDAQALWVDKEGGQWASPDFPHPVE